MNNIEIEIEDKTYTTKKLNELSIKDYNLIIDTINSPVGEVQKMYVILHSLAYIPYEILNLIDIRGLLQIDFQELLSYDTSKESIKPFYMFGEGQYELPVFDELSFGSWIDLDYFITNEGAMLNVLARLFIDDEKEINLETIEILSKQIEEDMQITDALTIFDVFSAWRLDLIKKNEALFTPTEEEEDEEPKEEHLEEVLEDEEEEESDGGSNWLDVAYFMAGDDILKVDPILDTNIISTLNFLNYQKEKNDRELEARRKQSNTN